MQKSRRWKLTLGMLAALGTARCSQVTSEDESNVSRALRLENEVNASVVDFDFKGTPVCEGSVRDCLKLVKSDYPNAKDIIKPAPFGEFFRDTISSLLSHSTIVDAEVIERQTWAPLDSEQVFTFSKLKIREVLHTPTEPGGCSSPISLPPGMVAGEGEMIVPEYGGFTEVDGISFQTARRVPSVERGIFVLDEDACGSRAAYLSSSTGIYSHAADGTIAALEFDGGPVHPLTELFGGQETTSLDSLRNALVAQSNASTSDFLFLKGETEDNSCKVECYKDLPNHDGTVLDENAINASGGRLGRNDLGAKRIDIALEIAEPSQRKVVDLIFDEAVSKINQSLRYAEYEGTNAPKSIRLAIDNSAPKPNIVVGTPLSIGAYTFLVPVTDLAYVRSTRSSEAPNFSKYLFPADKITIPQRRVDFMARDYYSNKSNHNFPAHAYVEAYMRLLLKSLGVKATGRCQFTEGMGREEQKNAFDTWHKIAAKLIDLHTSPEAKKSCSLEFGIYQYVSQNQGGSNGQGGSASCNSSVAAGKCESSAGTTSSTLAPVPCVNIVDPFRCSCERKCGSGY